MTEPTEAFLSYTRIDDEYFGGAITSLRKLLELSVQVVSGNKAFTIFQDIDGISFGLNWQQQLTEALATSRFLIPIVTPLFFNSDACRDELKQFIEHEKSLGREDLILPIYFVTAPVLERPELLREDVLASAINSRQRYDWRVQADLPLNDPKIRHAVRELAEKIATALERTSDPTVTNKPRSGLGLLCRGTPGPSPAMPVGAAARETSRLIESLGPAREKRTQQKFVLWVDDTPDNNIFERHAMAAYNIHFVLAPSTGQALAALRKQSFDAIISDMGRPPDDQAGYTLLEALRASGDQTPYFIYAGSKLPEQVREAQTRGAQGTTNMGDELIQMLLQSLNA